MKNLSFFLLVLISLAILVGIRQGADVGGTIALFCAVLNWHVCEREIIKLKQGASRGVQ